MARKDEQETSSSGERLIRSSAAKALRQAAGACSAPRPSAPAPTPAPAKPASTAAFAEPAPTATFAEPASTTALAEPASTAAFAEPASTVAFVEPASTAVLPIAAPTAALPLPAAPAAPAAPPAGGAASGAREPATLASDTASSPTRVGGGRAVADLQLLQAGSMLKHYEILRPLGRGGMGTVFVARDTKLGRLVAIKVLLRHSDHNAQRFLAEARATARCKHENIVVIHEVDERGGCPYMVLEYLAGRTLRDWLAEREGPDAPAPAFGGERPSERVPPALALELMVPVVRALACAHAQGVVHRDLKPANIVLTDAGPLKVLDFGIAKRLDAGELTALAAPGAEPLSVRGELTQPGTLLGTLPYMAPEQWRNEEVDARTDLWAVGILLFRLVAGAHPLAPITSTMQLAQISLLDVPMPSARDKCPEAGPLADVIDRCLKKEKAERFGSAVELLAALEALRADRRAPARPEDASPFAGLSAFQEADAGRFFGREAEVAAVLGRLRSQPLVAVAGPSGAGKSSFVRAGVVPALKRAHERAEAFVLRPGRRPLGALAEALWQLAEAPGEAAGTAGEVAAATGEGPRPGAGDPERLAALLRAQPGLFGTRLRARCRRPGGPHRLVLFVDQFEELYTLGAERAERAAFVACLESAADDASSPLRVVLSLRSDFLDRVAEDRPFAAELARGLLLLPPMGREGLREALLRPVEASGYRFETEAMAGAMLEALERAKSPLPLLQFTATKLWEARDRARRLLTQASYERLGGVAGALSAHADAVLAGLSSHDRRLGRELLVRLVTAERTRAVVGLNELRSLADDGDAVEQVVRRLADARLLLVEPSAGPEGATVELVHESLIDRWAQLGRWLDESAQDAQFVARLRAAAQQWQAGGEGEGLLWRDRAADEARQWLDRRRAETGAASPPGLAPREARYLQAVVALAGRSRRLRRAGVAGALAALSAIALVVSLLALRAKREADHARAEATRADREAALARNATRMAAARELSPSDPTTALALLREVEPPSLPREWADQAFLALHGGVAEYVLAHPDVVRSAAFSPDGKRLVTASSDKLVRVFDADAPGKPLVLRGHDDGVIAAAFSPDGTRLVTGARDKTVRVWRADGTGEPLVLRGHEQGVFAASFSPDGTRILSASNDKTLRIWSADGTGEPLVLRGHDDGVFAAAWSPDGRRVVSGAKDKTVRVWDADGRGKPLVLRGHGDVVYAVAWSPDGRSIVTSSNDRTARIWPLKEPPKPAGKAAPKPPTAGPPVVLRGHDYSVFGVSFSPDGRHVLTASWDKTVQLWNADGAGKPLELRGHSDMVYTAAFSPDGRRIVTASNDKTVRVWRADGAGKPLVLRGHEGEIYGASFSPDGRRVASASNDKTARVWNADGSGRPIVLQGHEGDVNKITWSPDGRLVATASNDKTARVWRADGAGKPLVLRGHEGGLRMAAFSPDGRRLATASEDKTLRIWNADGSGEPLVLRGHETSLTWATWSPDGKRIATGSIDKLVRVVNADGSGEPLVLRGHENTVYTPAFSPDGTRLVTGSKDKTLRVWNADGSGEPLVLRGHEGPIYSASFSPDGTRIVSASLDRTVRIWNADGSGEPLVLRGHEGAATQAAFSPDGRRLLTASVDKTIKIWTDLVALRGPDDPKLWAASSYCLPAERRVELLHTSEAAARADQQACERRVEGLRTSAAAPR
ncbi:MAG TPA: protein kinase [Polyangiaceae bacterium]|nr:protein kinase [Polyangiaceae bacterium]